MKTAFGILALYISMPLAIAGMQMATASPTQHSAPVATAAVQRAAGVVMVARATSNDHAKTR